MRGIMGKKERKENRQEEMKEEKKEEKKDCIHTAAHRTRYHIPHVEVVSLLYVLRLLRL